MHEVTYSSYLVAFMIDIVILAGVPLGVATVCGLFISVFQAVTQIQDQTLSQTVKIVAIVAVLLVFGGVLVSPLVNSTTNVFNEFSNVGH